MNEKTIEELGVEIARKEHQMENYTVAVSNPDLYNLFCDFLDAKGEIEILGACYKPSEVLEKIDINFFSDSLNNFRLKLTERDLMKISEYKSIVDEYKELQKELENKTAIGLYREKIKEKFETQLKEESVFCIDINAEGNIIVDVINEKFYFFFHDIHVPESKRMDAIKGQFFDENKEFYLDYIQLPDHEHNVRAEGLALIYDAKGKKSNPFNIDFEWPIDDYLRFAFNI